MGRGKNHIFSFRTFSLCWWRSYKNETENKNIQIYFFKGKLSVWKLKSLIFREYPTLTLTESPILVFIIAKLQLLGVNKDPVFLTVFPYIINHYPYIIKEKSTLLLKNIYKIYHLIKQKILNFYHTIGNLSEIYSR